jgi:hypothetical protein
MKKVKRFFDKPEDLKIPSYERVLKVVFVCEQKASGEYHFTTPLIITDLAVYVAVRKRYYMHGHCSILYDLFYKILKLNPEFRDFVAFCANEEILKYIEDKNKIVMDLEKIKASDCVSKKEHMESECDKLLNYLISFNLRRI